MTGNFHKNSNIDRLYMPRKLDGRGTKEMMSTYESRIVSAKQHLTQSKKNNKYLKKSMKVKKMVLLELQMN